MSFLKLPVTSVARGGALCGRGAETLGGVLDTFQLPSFLDGFSVLDVRLLHLTSRFHLGRNHTGWGTGLEGGGLVHSAVRLQVATSVCQTAV